MTEQNSPDLFNVLQLAQDLLLVRHLDLFLFLLLALHAESKALWVVVLFRFFPLSYRVRVITALTARLLHGYRTTDAEIPRTRYPMKLCETLKRARAFFFFFRRRFPGEKKRQQLTFPGFLATFRFI